MKTMLTTILAAAMAMPMAAQETKATNDTIVVNAPGKVLVTKAGNGAVNVAVNGKEGNEYYKLRYRTEIQEKDTTEWNLDLPFLKKQKSGWMVTAGGCYTAGVLFSGQEAGSEMDLGIEIGVTHLIGAKYYFGNSGTSFVTGLGGAWQRFDATDNTSTRFNRVNHALVAEAMPEGYSEGERQITNFMLNVPLQLTQRIGKSFCMSAGMLLHYNLHTCAKNKYKLGDKEFSEHMNRLKQRPFTYEYMASIGTDDFALFVKYNPKGLFRKNYGPQFSTWSIGIKFLNF